MTTHSITLHRLTSYIECTPPSLPFPIVRRMIGHQYADRNDTLLQPVKVLRCEDEEADIIYINKDGPTTFI